MRRPEHTNMHAAMKYSSSRAYFGLILRQSVQRGPRRFQRDLHHLVEGILPFLGREGLAGKNVVGDGQNGQRLLSGPLRGPVRPAVSISSARMPNLRYISPAAALSL